MKLYQAIVDYNDMKEATRVPLDHEVFCPILQHKNIDDVYIQVDDAVNDYGKRTDTRNIKYVAWHLDRFDAQPFYFKEDKRLPLDEAALGEIYKDYRSVRKAIKAGVLKEECE